MADVEAFDAGPLVGFKAYGIEYGFIGRLQGLKYKYRPDITNRATLERNFREKFEAWNRVRLTDAEFSRLLYELVGLIRGYFNLVDPSDDSEEYVDSLKHTSRGLRAKDRRFRRFRGLSRSRERQKGRAIDLAGRLFRLLDGDLLGLVHPCTTPPSPAPSLESKFLSGKNYAILHLSISSMVSVYIFPD